MSKKSFVLYNDMRTHIEKLTIEQRGQLLTAIFAHADGEDYSLDVVTDMAFGFISDQMDRDSEKYTEKCQKRSDAGKKGNEKRWNEHRKCDNDNRKNRKCDFSDKENRNASQTVANIADTDTVNDTNNDTDNVVVVNDNDTVCEFTDNDNNENDNFISHGLAKVTKAEYAELSEEYGEDNVKLYMQKCDAYLKRKGIAPYDSIALTISAWMKKDNIHKPQPSLLPGNADNRKHSYDLSEIEAQSMAYIKKIISEE